MALEILFGFEKQERLDDVDNAINEAITDVTPDTPAETPTADPAG